MTIWHYLYFADEAAARRVARELTESYSVDISQFEDRWLLRASHPALGSEDALKAVETALSDIAGAHGGSYDGWERETADRSRDATLRRN